MSTRHALAPVARTNGSFAAGLTTAGNASTAARSSTLSGSHVRGIGMPSRSASRYVSRLSHACLTHSQAGVATRTTSRRRSRLRASAATVSSRVGKTIHPCMPNRRVASSNAARVGSSSLTFSTRMSPRRVSRVAADRRLVVEHAHRDSSPPEAANDPESLVVAADHDRADRFGTGRRKVGGRSGIGRAHRYRRCST